jgi:hypothetical protein
LTGNATLRIVQFDTLRSVSLFAEKGSFMKLDSYRNKVVRVTGGTSGIGKATAIAFAEAGGKAVLTGGRFYDRNVAQG